MHGNSLNAGFEMALREGDGRYAWRALDHNPPPASAKELELFNDPNLLREVERFIVKNRLSIATAHSRYTLRRAFEKLEAKYSTQPIGEFMIPTI